MTEDIKPEVIKMTQDTLGKFIKKPPLTEKLLKKPPFRFLHDIITCIIRDTGLFVGLFSDQEMLSDNIKDRNGKIAFLQKLIDCVSLVTNKKIAARPNKIVAGLEPTKTNELLQTIGYALKRKLNSTDAVAQIINGAPTTAATNKTKSKDDRKVKESPRTTKNDLKPSKSNNKIKTSPRTKDVPKKINNKNDTSPKTKISKEKIDTSPKIKISKEKIDTPKESPKEEIIETKPEIKQPEEELMNTEIPAEEIAKEIPKETVIEVPKVKVEIESNNRPVKNLLRPPSVRPSSARPGAPRFKEKNDFILPQDEFIPMGKVNVIVENFSATDNEETVVVETIPELLPQQPINNEISGEKGHLVNQILEQIEESSHKHTVEIEWEASGKKNRENANKEMDKLRESIQTLTRAANPLGKLMNFLQEDVDSMKSELKMWINLNDKLTTEIKIQEKLNADSIEPLKVHLNKLEDDIEKQYDLISTTQANILRNEYKIKSLLIRDE